LREVASPDIGAILRAGYAFALSEDAELAVDLDENGEPTRFAAGHEAILSLHRRDDAIAVRREDDALDALSDRLD
jgi:hypothetical protein